MNKIIDLKKHGGHLKIYAESNIFLVEPSGIINPSLVKKDLELAYEFGKDNKDWFYVVNTENVLFPNPLNLLYLSKIKNLPNKIGYIIYIPSLIVRLLARLTSFIIKPDFIYKNKEDFDQRINQLLNVTKEKDPFLVNDSEHNP